MKPRLLRRGFTLLGVSVQGIGAAKPGDNDQGVGDSQSALPRHFLATPYPRFTIH